MTSPTSTRVLPRAHSAGRKIAQAIALLVWMATAGIGPAAAQTGNVTIAITSPQSEETIHDNTGKVPVTVAIKNGDVMAAGGLYVLLDGHRYGPARHSVSFVLKSVTRGEHTLQVHLVDAGGNVIAASDSVKFYMWQASILFPGRQ